MKKKWEYKYPERVVSAMVSEDHVLIGGQLYFVHMTNGTYPRAGIYRVDVNTGEAAAVWETTDFLRTMGVYKDGCFYFTSLRGNAYCVTTEGEVRWKRQLGEKPGAADWNVVLEGARLYGQMRRGRTVPAAQSLWKRTSSTTPRAEAASTAATNLMAKQCGPTVQKNGAAVLWRWTPAR